MNTVPKNIKRLRMRDSISQEILAEKLNVTRQAISSWETGKTQPDIDTLLSIAVAFDVDVSEVIYGEKTQPSALPQDKKKRKRAAIIFSAVTLVFILLEIFLIPYLKYLTSTRYIGYPLFVYMYFICPAFYMCISQAFFNALSLAYEIRLKSQRIRKAVAVVSMIFLGLYYLLAANYFLGYIPMKTAFLLYNIVVPLVKNPSLFLIPGTALFFGFNK